MEDTYEKKKTYFFAVVWSDVVKLTDWMWKCWNEWFSFWPNQFHDNCKGRRYIWYWCCTKRINIKGYKFTIPQKLSELEKGLTYKYVSDELADGFYKVEISGKNEQILDVVVRAKKKNDKNAVIDNIAVETSDSNVCGLIPLVTAKDEVIEKFGEPNEQKTEIIREEKEFFYYGIEEYDDGYLNIRAKMMTVCFNKDKIVETITITYSN